MWKKLHTYGKYNNKNTTKCVYICYRERINRHFNCTFVAASYSLTCLEYYVTWKIFLSIWYFNDFKTFAYFVNFIPTNNIIMIVFEFSILLSFALTICSSDNICILQNFDLIQLENGNYTWIQRRYLPHNIWISIVLWNVVRLLEV